MSGEPGSDFECSLNRNPPAKRALLTASSGSVSLPLMRDIIALRFSEVTMSAMLERVEIQKLNDREIVGN